MKKSVNMPNGEVGGYAEGCKLDVAAIATNISFNSVKGHSVEVHIHGFRPPKQRYLYRLGELIWSGVIVIG